jgi:hypothetical protein
MRLTTTAVATAALGLVALPAEPASGQFEAVAAVAACPAWDVTYAVSARLRITDTPMAAGDGEHPIGPGTFVVQVDRAQSRVQVVSLELKERFTVHPKALLWNATVVTDANARATADASGFAGMGTFANGTLRWAGPIHGYRTDGSLVCEGSLCGKFGAPPAGRSELHWPPSSVPFQPLRFGENGATFQMPYSLVAQSDSPKQKTYLSIAGREIHRTCIRVPAH